MIQTKKNCHQCQEIDKTFIPPIEICPEKIQQQLFTLQHHHSQFTKIGKQLLLEDIQKNPWMTESADEKTSCPDKFWRYI